MTRRKYPQANAFIVSRRERRDLQTLVEIAYGAHDPRTLQRLADRNIDGSSAGFSRFLRVEKWPGEEVSEMDRFRAWLKDGLESMFQPNGWKLSTKDRRFDPFTVRLHAGKHPRAVYEDPSGGAAAGLVAWRLTETYRFALKRCAWAKCGKIFVSHKSSDYCSPRHSQNARTAKYRAKARSAK